MNKQRKVLITITYNEMGVIIDTKAEEVAQPNLQPTCNQLATDIISRQAAIDAICEDGTWLEQQGCTEITMAERKQRDVDILSALPSFSQPHEYDRPAEPCEDAVSRADMLNELDGWIEGFDANCHKESFADMKLVRSSMSKLPSVTPEQQHGRIFQEIVVEYPSYNTYPEYKGKPYFSIKYTENGQEFIGYGTYKPEVLSEYLKEYFMPSAQPERTCVNCGRTANNGGWYADGGTRCPIEEHYALPKDGYCHLWEKRNVTDDDYPERREE